MSGTPGYNGNALPYVYTNPDSATLINATDRIFVLDSPIGAKRRKASKSLKGSHEPDDLFDAQPSSGIALGDRGARVSATENDTFGLEEVRGQRSASERRDGDGARRGACRVGRTKPTHSRAGSVTPDKVVNCIGRHRDFVGRHSSVMARCSATSARASRAWTRGRAWCGDRERGRGGSGWRRARRRRARVVAAPLARLSSSPPSSRGDDRRACDLERSLHDGRLPPALTEPPLSSSL